MLMKITLATGYSASTSGWVAVPLVPKSDGVNLRPVGVFASIHRVLGAVVKDQARSWEGSLASSSRVFCAGARKSAADVVWRQTTAAQIYQHRASHEGSGRLRPPTLEAAALLVDIVCCLRLDGPRCPPR